MRITSLKTKADQDVRLGSLTVLVGPNNAGKSQTLRDIQSFFDSTSAPMTLLSHVDVQYPAKLEQLLTNLEIVPHPQNATTHIVRGMGSSLGGREEVGIEFSSYTPRYENAVDKTFALHTFGRFRLAYLNASTRLGIAGRTSSFNPHDESPSNVLQLLFAGGETSESALRKVFRETFGMDIRLDYSGMQHLVLRVAKAFGDIPTDPRDAISIMRQHKELDQQGDGFRSFVGVVLSLLMATNRIVLLDEPEAFLHPAQARQLGRWIANQSAASESQIIVATHSANFLAGILTSTAPVDIFRLNRTNDTTAFAHISTETTKKLSQDPVLSSQRVLESVFSSGVVICEADADRAVYQSVAAADEGHDVLVVHAHNKQTIPKVASILHEARIPVVAVADLDVLNSERDLAAILASLTDAPLLDDIERRRRGVAAAVETRTDDDVLHELRGHVDELSRQMHANEHDLAGARGALNRIRRGSTRWAVLKREGINGIPEGDRPALIELIDSLKKLGLFIVPVGELENWIDLGVRKSRWTVLALETIAEEGPPETLRTFVREVLDALRNP
jgi:hypothetical protein